MGSFNGDRIIRWMLQVRPTLYSIHVLGSAEEVGKEAVFSWTEVSHLMYCLVKKSISSHLSQHQDLEMSEDVRSFYSLDSSAVMKA